MSLVNIKSAKSFDRAVKKLKPNQKKDLDKAVREVAEDPQIGQQKKGDLSYLKVHKFKMNNQLTLLGYEYENGELFLTLISVGTHENFYRDIKR